MPKTSIITIILNGKKYIEQTIQSVLSLEYPCQEYIIMDGGSINGTVGIIKRCEKQLTCWGSTPGKRIRDGLNKGIKRATGELIKIINSDDYYAPRAINEVIDRYRRNPESDIFHGRSQTVTGSPQEWNNYPLAHSKLLYSVSISHPGVLVAKAAYERYGNFILPYKIAMNCSFFSRSLLKGEKFKYNDKVVSCY